METYLEFQEGRLKYTSLLKNTTKVVPGEYMII
jgi:hypothetical protein